MANLIGIYTKPDGWEIGGLLTKADDYKDSSFPGCQYRLESGRYTDLKLAVNIKVTGRKIHLENDLFKLRVQVEFVGDGEPSSFCGGWIHSKDYSFLAELIGEK